MRKISGALCALGLLLSAAAPADAHHSFAMFDMSKNIMLTGTVKEFRWSMPHVWIHLVIVGPDGKASNWSGECHSPNIIARKGWKSNSLSPGDKIVVQMHPMRDGSAAGSVISVKLPNGQVLMNAESADRV